MTFKEYSGLDLVSIGEEVLQEWKKEGAFEKSLELREGAPEFIFFEGPPSANGMPGIHHVMARSIKDAVCRYKTQTGYKVRRRAGWDTHGLPVELGVEQKLGITKEDIGTKISVEEYNRTCREEVMKYTAEWRNLTERIGYWVDMDDPYITYDNRYIETLWWLLKDIYGKGLLYKGKSIQPYSPAARTGLSTHELNQPGCYRDVKDTTCTAQFKIKDAKFGDNAYFLAWTTTPWTLPSNTALCVGPKITYNIVKADNPYTGTPCTYILAKDLVASYFGEKKIVTFEIMGECSGNDLVGLEYEQLIPWVNPGNGAFRVIAGDFVTTEDGTGIVHIAPTFGADDAFVAKKAGVLGLSMLTKKGETRPMVDMTGKFFLLEDLDDAFVKSSVDTQKYQEFAGRFVKNAYDPTLTEQDETLDVAICMMLKQQGTAVRIEKHVHNYPHCWRTDKPVLYYPLDSWFIKSTACREEMMELNKTINWKPESTGTGRFGKWLENLNDWNLSRSRYWGTPLPIWRTDDGKEEICIGSIEELFAEIDKAIAAGVMKENPYKNFKVGDYSKENYDPKNIDLHRPYVDGIVLVSAGGKPMHRELDLIDVWFDSGAMPYAQVHYPFETQTPQPPMGGCTDANPLVYGRLKELAAEQQKNPTPAEDKLWQYLSGRNIEGCRFTRQYIIGDSIADFACLDKKLVIEVDGGYHNNPEQKEYDALRTQAIEKQGYRVIRFTNEEVSAKLDFVLNTIKEFVHTSNTPLGGLGGSVHLTKFPVCDSSLIDQHLEECMQLAQQATSMIFALRKKANKKVRQPLLKAVIPAPDVKTLEELQYVANLIKAEVNVKELQIVTAEDSTVKLVKRIKPNFKTLGKKYGKQMKEIAAAVGAFTQAQIGEVETAGQITLPLPSGEVVVELADVEIATEDMPGWLVANEGNLTIALDIEVSEELRQEGIARELVNRIQNIRKSNGYEIIDKIAIQIEKQDEINAAVETYKAYISTQVLANSLTLVDALTNATELDFEDFMVKVKVEKE